MCAHIAIVVIDEISAFLRLRLDLAFEPRLLSVPPHLDTLFNAIVIRARLVKQLKVALFAAALDECAL